MSGVYEGYHREWVKDESWRFGTDYTKCRKPHCPNPPVAEFYRLVRVRRTEVVKRPYAYCADHLYGRRIHNGEVQINRLVKDEESL